MNRQKVAEIISPMRNLVRYLPDHSAAESISASMLNDDYNPVGPLYLKYCEGIPAFKLGVNVACPIEEIQKQIDKFVGPAWTLHENIFWTKDHDEEDTKHWKTWVFTARPGHEIVLGLFSTIKYAPDSTLAILGANNDDILACKALCESIVAVDNVAKKNSINIICFNDGFYLKTIGDLTPVESPFDFSENYNIGFQGFYDHITNKLNNTSKGIVLLHGAPGTGKTNALRHLIAQLKKTVIYLPPDMATMLSSPQFVSFLMDHSNSVLIVEDAETVLKTRDAGGNQAVANLLNVSDGLLSDALKIQLICTFNTSLMDIDSALRRPGRLIGEFEFKKLQRDRASSLLSKLYNKPIVAKEDMTLGEIYNYEEEKHQSVIPLQKVGFV